MTATTTPSLKEQWINLQVREGLDPYTAKERIKGRQLTALERGGIEAEILSAKWRLGAAAEAMPLGELLAKARAAEQDAAKKWAAEREAEHRSMSIKEAFGLTTETRPRAAHRPIEAPRQPAPAPSPRPPASPPAKFDLQTAAQFAAGAPLDYVVKGVLPRADVAMLYGESGSGKSFFTADLLMCVARGVPWRGHRVKQGRVLYVAAEGGRGFRNRLVAYAQHHQVDLASVPMMVLDGAPNLLRDDHLGIASALKAAGGVDVVVIDTLAQTTPGANENAGEDMGPALAHCKELHKLTGAVVLLVHHSGKDATRGARGWSGIRAAVDAEIEIVRSGDVRAARVSKMKDGEDGATFGFRLVQVPIGRDADGDLLTSCVIEHTEETPKKAKEPAGKWQLSAWQAVRELIGDGQGVDRAEAIDAAVNACEPPKDGEKDRRAESIKRAIDSLIDQGLLSTDGTRLVLPHSANVPHEDA